jgi:hypothetical protein
MVRPYLPSVMLTKILCIILSIVHLYRLNDTKLHQFYTMIHSKRNLETIKNIHTDVIKPRQNCRHVKFLS